jgi:hypothetical protein
MDRLQMIGFLIVYGLSFEHINFAINGKYSKKNYNNANYYASLVIFHSYKNAILRNVHSLGWLL